MHTTTRRRTIAHEVTQATPTRSQAEANLNPAVQRSARHKAAADKKSKKTKQKKSSENSGGVSRLGAGVRGLVTQKLCGAGAGSGSLWRGLQLRGAGELGLCDEGACRGRAGCWLGVVFAFVSVLGGIVNLRVGRGLFGVFTGNAHSAP
jgi:hypothetical protein